MDSTSFVVTVRYKDTGTGTGGTGRPGGGGIVRPGGGNTGDAPDDGDGT